MVLADCKTLNVSRVESIAPDRIRTRKPQGSDSWATISNRGCGHMPQAKRGPGQHSSARQVREARAQRPVSQTPKAREVALGSVWKGSHSCPQCSVSEGKTGWG